jgi:hypothetical protein
MACFDAVSRIVMAVVYDAMVERAGLRSWKAS